MRCPDVHAARTGVLGGVGNRLSHREVRCRLYWRREAARQVDVCRGGHRGIQRERSYRVAEATLGQHRRVDPGHQAAQLGQRPGGVLPRRGDQGHRGVRVGLDQSLGGSQRDAQRDQPSLGAVVQVPFHSPQFSGGSAHGVHPGRGQPPHPADQLRVAPGQPGTRADRARRQPHPEGQHDQPRRQVEHVRHVASEQQIVERVASRRGRARGRDVAAKGQGEAQHANPISATASRSAARSGTRSVRAKAAATPASVHGRTPQYRVHTSMTTGNRAAQRVARRRGGRAFRTLSIQSMLARTQAATMDRTPLIGVGKHPPVARGTCAASQSRTSARNAVSAGPGGRPPCPPAHPEAFLHARASCRPASRRPPRRCARARRGAGRTPSPSRPQPHLVLTLVDRPLGQRQAEGPASPRSGPPARRSSPPVRRAARPG